MAQGPNWGPFESHHTTCLPIEFRPVFQGLGTSPVKRWALVYGNPGSKNPVVVPSYARSLGLFSKGPREKKHSPGEGFHYVLGTPKKFFPFWGGTPQFLNLCSLHRNSRGFFKKDPLSAEEGNVPPPTAFFYAGRRLRSFLWRRT